MVYIFWNKLGQAEASQVAVLEAGFEFVFLIRAIKEVPILYCIQLFE